ncbi:HAMP domain-containing histidine kinase [Eubacteriales bacterium OttesenSCG-928-M02]|nr:HAMP domain-containing histidine kinase [Eubacteriales bacterium OttesenSCG-928-M02]
MFWFVLGLIGLVAGVAVALFSYGVQNTSLKKLKRDLQWLNETDTNALLRVPVPGEGMEELVLEINNSIKKGRSVHWESQRSERDLRHAIENVSHDLRTPLTSILGYLQLIEDPRTLPEERAQYFRIVRTRAATLEQLINQFYDLSRVQANEYNFRIAPMDLSQLLMEQMAAYYQDFTQRGMEPHLDILEGAPRVLADEGAAVRILTNLIQNILKHGVGRVDIALKVEGGNVVTTFTNDAPQLDPMDVPQLFERFFTVDRMRTGQNTGLGLAIVKAMADQMGQEIWADAKDGRLTIGIRWRTEREIVL